MLEDFSVYALLYGDYPELAKQCLDSIRPLNPLVGLNAVSPATREIAAPYRCVPSATNLHKYPMMRKLFASGVRRKYTMWFDDDSYVVQPNMDFWLKRVAEAMELPGTDMVGRIYQLPFAGHQRAWVQQQPWYTGRETVQRELKFCTGGWWCIRTAILEKFGYPWPELDHNGGDTMLGELLYQQNLRIGNYDWGVMINAGMSGKHSGAPRRGYSSPPLGSILQPTGQPLTTKRGLQLDY